MLKLYGWEPYFLRKVGTVRDKQIKLLSDRCIIEALNALVFEGTPCLVSTKRITSLTSIFAAVLVIDMERVSDDRVISRFVCCTCLFLQVLALCFGGAIYLNPETVLSAETIFVSIALMEIIQIPICVIPFAITFGSEACVSLRRVSKFLQLEEMDPEVVSREPMADDTCISIDDGVFTWGDKKRASLAGYVCDSA